MKSDGIIERILRIPSAAIVLLMVCDGALGTRWLTTFAQGRVKQSPCLYFPSMPLLLIHEALLEGSVFQTLYEVSVSAAGRPVPMTSRAPGCPIWHLTRRRRVICRAGL